MRRLFNGRLFRHTAGRTVSSTTARGASPINQGLEGVPVAETTISNVDGIRGELVLGGYMMEEIIDQGHTYEDTLHMFLRGALPTSAESAEFARELASRRPVSTDISKVIDALPKGLDYMDAFRTGMSVLGHEVGTGYPPSEEQVLDLVAKSPTIVARYYCANTGKVFNPANDLSVGHAAYYLHHLTGNDPTTEAGKLYARALDVYFITTIEHGMNASTFTARVTTSTNSDLASALTAAISTLKGPLHGGAPSEVIDMLDAIGTKDNAEAWITNVLESGGRLMGFGHRVYKNYDPRATALQRVVEQLPTDDGNEQLDLSRHVEEVAVRLLAKYKPGRNLYPNVEFGAAAVLKAVGLPSALYPTTFGVSRVGGWAAHVLEQSAHNRLIRPNAIYVGEWPKKIQDRMKEEAAGSEPPTPSV